MNADLTPTPMLCHTERESERHPKTVQTNATRSTQAEGAGAGTG